MTYVPPHQESLKRTTNSTYRLTHCRSKEKASGPVPSPHSTCPSPISATARSLFESTRPEVPLRVRTRSEVPLRPPQQRPFTKTLSSALDTAQRQGSTIHRVRYAVKYPPRFKCVNTPISMGQLWRVVDLYISISTIRSSNYEEIARTNHALMEI